MKGVTGNQSSSSLKEIWSTKNSVSVSNRSDKPTSEGVLLRNLIVNFRSETYLFILSTEQFLDFIIDLESTVGEKLNTKNFIFLYAIDIMDIILYAIDIIDITPTHNTELPSYFQGIHQLFIF